MARLDWENVFKDYAVGLDRGALYFGNDESFAWNGLISVDETARENDLKPVYFEGVLVNLHEEHSGYRAQVEAMTYPYMLEDYVVGLTDGRMLAGMLEENQPFGFTYRTQKQDGYKIHLVYNIVATIDTISHETVDPAMNLTPFVFDFYATPVAVTGIRPTPHVFVDTAEANDAAVLELESILYGSDEHTPRFPSLEEVVEIFATLTSELEE